MDALARIAPVAAPLLADVDDVLASLGAPPEHPVWTLLRRLGVTPADALASFVDVDPIALRGAGAALRAQAESYAGLGVPVDVAWQGAAGDGYAVRATALADQLDAMAGRLEATASYVEAVADWQSTARSALANALADVLGSRQAVTMRSGPQLATVRAAADIGAHVLDAAATAWAEGEALLARWAGALAELPYAPFVADPGAVAVPIDVHL